MKKLDLLSACVLIVLAFSFVSCEKNKVNNEDEQENVSCEDLKEALILIVEKEDNKSSYFTEDSLLQMEINPNVLNGLGQGIDKSTGMLELSIFKTVETLQPITKLNVDEYFTTKYIVAYEKINAGKLTDSIIAETLKTDSSYILTFKPNNASEAYQADSTIFLYLVLMKRFGTVQLDIQNSQINDYLTYKTNLFDSTNNDEILVSPKIFKDTYGDMFCSSMTLGVYMTQEFEIENVYHDCQTQEDALKEAAILVDKMKNGEGSWNELIENNTYFKKSEIVSYNSTAIPRFNLFDDFVTKINYLDSVYKKADFGVLSRQYKPFSEIYPDYDFINSDTIN